MRQKLLTNKEYKNLVNKGSKFSQITLQVTQKLSSDYNKNSLLDFIFFENKIFVKNKSSIEQVLSYLEESSENNNPRDSTSEIFESVPPSSKRTGGKKKRSPAKRKPTKRKPAKRKPTGKKKVRKIHKGPRGGRYYISKRRKVYL